MEVEVLIEQKRRICMLGGNHWCTGWVLKNITIICKNGTVYKMSQIECSRS